MGNFAWLAWLGWVCFAGDEGGLRLRIPLVDGFARVPVVSGFPLPYGCSIDTARVTVREPSGRIVPSTVRAAFDRAAPKAEGRRWIRAEFEGTPGETYRVRWVRAPAGQPEPPAEAPSPVEVHRQGSKIVIRSDTLVIGFDERRGPLPIEIHRRDEVGPPVGSIDLVWPREYGEWRASGTPSATLSIEETTASRVTVLAVGSFGENEVSKVDYRIRTTLLPSTGEIRFDLRLRPRSGATARRSAGSDPSGTVADRMAGHRVALLVRPPRDAARWARLPGRPGRMALASGPVVLESSQDGVSFSHARGPMQRLATTVGRLAFECDRFRCVVEVPQFKERHPKTLQASASGMRVDLARVSSWKTHSARRFTVLVRFEGPSGGLSAAERAMRPVIAPSSTRSYRATALPQPGRTLRGKAGSLYSRVVDRVIQEHRHEQARTRADGEWNFGDWRFFEGWGNLEFDTSFGCFLEFYRSGRRDAWELGMRGIEHWVDVDRAVEIGAPEFGLPLRHGRDHGSRVDLGHVWVEGLLHAAYLSGDPFLREAFEETTAALVRIHEDRGHRITRRERDAAWQLLALAAAHEAFQDSATLRVVRNLELRVLDRVDPATGWIRLDDARSGGTLGSTWKVTPWVATGIVVPALVRSWRITANPAALAAAEGLVRAVLAEALEPRVAGMRASLTLAGGRVVDRGGFVRGDWAMFAARGFVDAGIALGDESMIRSGERLAREALEHLTRDSSPLDGRARSRILRNGPFLGRPGR